MKLKSISRFTARQPRVRGERAGGGRLSRPDWAPDPAKTRAFLSIWPYGPYKILANYILSGRQLQPHNLKGRCEESLCLSVYSYQAMHLFRRYLLYTDYVSQPVLVPGPPDLNQTHSISSRVS